MEGSARSIPGCTVDTDVIERGGGYGIGDECGEDICHNNLCRLVMVDVIRRMV